MKNSLFSAWKPMVPAWAYLIVIIFIIMAIAGKPAITWVLMKLYEFFIQKTPLH